MDCRCNEATELYGDEAETYAAGHLVVGEAENRGEERFSCPDTGRRWLLDRPDDTGQARLRREPF